MLANWETEDITRVRKGKAISMIHVSIAGAMTAKYEHGRVWRDDNLFFERELFPFLWIKNRFPS
jgi:hypothetical protein